MSRLDALVSAIDSSRRAALTERLFGREGIDAVLAAEGEDAAWVAVDWCRNQIAQLPRYGWTGAQHTNIIVAFSRVAARFATHADLPAVWIDLLATVPSHKPVIANAIYGAMPSNATTLAAMRRGLETQSIPHRRLLANRLRASGTLDHEFVLTWFADPTLRPIAEDFFTPGLENYADLLRERLPEAKAGERESIVRLLRRLDPKLTLAGARDISNDGELQTRLREAPADEEVAAVWADSLIDRQDPRGELIALELAIRHAEPERALELSRTQAALVAAQRKALWNKPGGFPFREKYRGRSALAFHSDWNHRMRGNVDSIVDRVQAFIETFTTIRGPRCVFFGRRYETIAQTAPFDEPSQLSIDLCAALGADAIGVADKHGGFVLREGVTEPLANHDAFREICMREPQLTLDYEFLLTWPGTGVVLPHHEGDHYAGGRPLSDALRIYLADRSLKLSIAFPYEDAADPQFVELYENMCETLGRAFTPSQWSKLNPSADGKKLVGKKFRFTGEPARR